MRHNYVPAPYSIYKGFRKLRPGHFLVLADGEREPRIETYWSARDASERARAHPFDGSRDEAVAALEGVLKQSIRGQMMADVPLGAFLSGGIDSSTVVALMQSMSSQPVRTFTIGFHQAGYNEAEHAKQVARHLGTDHTELYVTEREAMDVIPALPQIYCEPFSDSSQIPTYLVSKLARQNVTVSLSGDGGDELFSGYTRYSIADDFWKKLSRVPHPLRRATAGLATLPSPAFYDGIAQPLMSLLPERRRLGRVGDRVHKAARLLAMRSPDDLYLHLCSHWSDPASLVAGSREPPTMLTGLDALPQLPGNVERMMYLDLLSYLPDDILVKVDRAAMAVSLETRVPMLDHRVVEFAMSLPLSILRNGGKTKWPLRQLLYKFVPGELVERPKMGFGVPIDSWLRGALRDWAEDLLERGAAEGGWFLRSRADPPCLARPSLGPAEPPISALERADVPGLARGAKGHSARPLPHDGSMTGACGECSACRPAPGLVVLFSLFAGCMIRRMEPGQSDGIICCCGRAILWAQVGTVRTANKAWRGFWWAGQSSQQEKNDSCHGRGRLRRDSGSFRIGEARNSLQGGHAQTARRPSCNRQYRSGDGLDDRARRRGNGRSSRLARPCPEREGL